MQKPILLLIGLLTFFTEKIEGQALSLDELIHLCTIKDYKQIRTKLSQYNYSFIRSEGQPRVDVYHLNLNRTDIDSNLHYITYSNFLDEIKVQTAVTREEFELYLKVIQKERLAFRATSDIPHPVRKGNLMKFESTLFPEIKIHFIKAIKNEVVGKMVLNSQVFYEIEFIHHSD